MRVDTLDLGFMGSREMISSFLAPAGDGFVLFETGPASTVDTLSAAVGAAGFELGALRAIFVTHVHLDHAGGAGTLARRTGCRVYAHPKGAHHLLDPHDKLLPSAERLYRDLMVPLWGVTESVPEDQLAVAEHGEKIQVEDLEITSWHTPGHAVHHVAWQLDGAVATGDVAGVRFPGSRHVLPPMPPPDIDVPEWKSSIDLVRSLGPQRLLLTHFGEFDDVERHLDELEWRLDRWTALAERVVAEGGGTETLADRLLALDEEEMSVVAVPPPVAARYRQLCPMEGNSAGLHRYLRKRAESAG